LFLHFDNKVDISYTTFVACVIKLTFRDHIVCLFMSYGSHHTIVINYL